MGVFDDHKFEQLDWMTQITETIDSDLNGLLARLPDRVTFDADTLLKNVSSSRLSMNTRSVVRDLLSALPCRDTFNSLSWEEESKLVECFKFELKGDVELDIRTGILSGEVALVKMVQTLEDQDLQGMMGLKGLEEVNRVRWGEDVPIQRMNEVLDMLGKCEEVMRNRSGKKKMQRIKSRLGEIFKTNEWRIRDMDLANKVGCWISGYIRTGNLADLTNFCKLKVMTHSNMPIYSIKEEK
jgi:hypothetical protein